MPTITANTSTAIALPAGQDINGTGAGSALVGNGAAGAIPLTNGSPWQIGPFLTAQTVNITATGAINYVIEDPLADPARFTTPQVNAVQALVSGAGLKHDGSDESAAVQSIIDAIWLLYGGKGGTLILPAGKTTVMQGIIWRPGVSIVCLSGYANLSELNTEWFGHRLKLPTNATQPLLQNDTANGYIRNQSLDSPTLNQRYHGGTLMGLHFSGSRNSALHTTDCDLIRLTRAWCVSIIGCSAVDSRGFGMRILDCNCINVVDCNFQYSGVFCYSLADSIFRGGQYGNGNGFTSTPFWVTGASQKNQFQSIFVYNNQSNGLVGFTTRAYAIPFVATVFTSADGSNPNTFLKSVDVASTTSHLWTTGTPVTVQSTGTLPGGITADTTYYVVAINAARIALATSPDRASRDIRVTISTTGTGTITLTVGESANLYVNDGSTKNRFSGIRSDQAFGWSVLVGRAPANAFSEMTIQEGSFGNYVGWVPAGNPTGNIAPVPGPAVAIRNSSTQTSLGGAWSIDGSKTGTLNQATGFESRQKFGVDIDTTSFPGTVVAPTVSSINHTSANSEAGAANWNPSHANPNRITYPASQFTPSTGATATTFGGTRRYGISMAADPTDGFANTAVQLPPGWESVNVVIYWVASTVNAGNVSWALQIGSFATTENTNAADAYTSSVFTTAVTGAADILLATTVTAVDFSQFVGRQVYLRVKHAGADVANTYADAPILSHVVFERI